MAEIKIEKKKPVWPWIILVLIILAGVYFFWYYNDTMNGTDDEEMLQDTLQERNEGMIDNSATDSTTLYSGSYGKIAKEKTIADYLTYIENPKMSTDSEYIAGALMKLINATEDEAEQLNVDVTADLEQAREDAFDINSDPEPSVNAGKLKQSATEIASALVNIQRHSFPKLYEASVSLKEAVNKIDAKIPVTQQNENVRSFFDNAGKLLQKMNETESNQL